MLLVTGDVDHRFTEPDFFEEAAVLTADAAEWLLDHGVEMVGNDFLTEGIASDARPVHHALLGAEVPIMEYLSNTHSIADSRVVEFCCLPLRTPGLEAAPARVIVRDEASDTTISQVEREITRTIPALKPGTFSLHFRNQEEIAGPGRFKEGDTVVETNTMTETGGEGHVRQLEEDGRVSETVLRAIATVSNRPLLELPPLQESIDADAVDGMFESPTRGCSLRFEYAEYDVTVEPERVHVRERR